jgi:hypothetical protein
MLAVKGDDSPLMMSREPLRTCIGAFHFHSRREPLGGRAKEVLAPLSFSSPARRYISSRFHYSLCHQSCQPAELLGLSLCT